MKDTKRRHWFFFARESSASTLSGRIRRFAMPEGQRCRGQSYLREASSFLGLAACPSTAALLALSCRTREKLERGLREPV